MSLNGKTFPMFSVHEGPTWSYGIPGYTGSDGLAFEVEPFVIPGSANPSESSRVACSPGNLCADCEGGPPCTNGPDPSARSVTIAGVFTFVPAANGAMLFGQLLGTCGPIAVFTEGAAFDLVAEMSRYIQSRHAGQPINTVSAQEVRDSANVVYHSYRITTVTKVPAGFPDLERKVIAVPVPPIPAASAGKAVTAAPAAVAQSASQS